MLRRADAPPQGVDDCARQTDGTIGLGCGARSYTSVLHCSADWAALDSRFPSGPCPRRGAGLPRRTGESVVSVDGAGAVRRCHFVRDGVGNPYDGSYRATLRPRAGPSAVWG